MFDSGIKAAALIEQIKKEADIAIPVPDSSYILWLNALEQLLYTELIREQGKIELSNVSDSVIDIDTLSVPGGEGSVRFEDILTIYADRTQLIRSTVASGSIFPDTYYKTGNNIGLNLAFQPERIKLIYLIKPELKTADNINARNIMLPVEFTELVKAKLRGEAYKLVNEDSIAAKWINDYNILLETFKSWLSAKQADFGL